MVSPTSTRNETLPRASAECSSDREGASDINAHGHVLGRTLWADGYASTLWMDDVAYRVQDLIVDMLGAETVQVTSIEDDGSMLGSIRIPGYTTEHAVLIRPL